MKTLSEQTMIDLQAAGWFPGRNIDISNELQILQRDSYPIFPTVVNFLKEFGRLRIIFRRTYIKVKVYNINSELYFDTEHALSAFRRSTFELYSEGLDIPLCPIGADNSGITLAMGSDNKVYGIYNPQIFIIGDTGEEAIENYSNWTPSNPFTVVRDFSKED